MDKTDSLYRLYNSMANLNTKMFRALLQGDTVSFTNEELLEAKVSLFALEIIISKEDIIEEIEKLPSSKMDDDYLDEIYNTFNFINGMKMSNDIENGAAFLTVVRNKIAHGAFTLTPDSTCIIIHPYEHDIKLPIDLLYNYLTNIHRLKNVTIKGNEYNKYSVYNKTFDFIKEPLETDEDIMTFLKLLEVVNFHYKRIDGKDLSSLEKMDFRKETIEFSKIYSKVGTSSFNNLKNDLINRNYKDGYHLGISKTRANKVIDIEEFKERIKLLNKQYYKYPDTSALNQLAINYGEEVYKMIDKTQLEDFFLVFTSVIDTITESNNKLSYGILAEKSANTSMYLEEIFGYMEVLKIWSLYAYPHDNVYSKSPNYHIDRDDELDYALLDLSELNRDIKYDYEINLAIDKLSRDSITKQDSYVSKMVETNNKLKQKIEQRNALLRKKNPSVQNIINKLELEIQKMLNDISYYNELYKLTKKDYNDNINIIKADFKENNDYFKNKAIIEGIRNSISHGGIEIVNAGKCDNVYHLQIRFINEYEGEICFDETYSVYELESLFSETNTRLIDEFLKNNKKRTI